MVITIDGPSGSGKSSVSKSFAETINFEVLDTGAMYRCVAVLFDRQDKELTDPIFQNLIKNMEIVFQKNIVYLNGEDVSLKIRTPKIDMLTSKIISVDPFVRNSMCMLQRKIGEKANIVAEGRDMGSHVFPDAALKFYLTASAEVRAKRRVEQLQSKGIIEDFTKILQEIETRDLYDSSRELNPLSITDDAIFVDTSDLSEDKVLAILLEFFDKKKLV